MIICKFYLRVQCVWTSKNKINSRVFGRLKKIFPSLKWQILCWKPTRCVHLVHLFHLNRRAFNGFGTTFWKQFVDVWPGCSAFFFVWRSFLLGQVILIPSAVDFLMTVCRNFPESEHTEAIFCQWSVRIYRLSRDSQSIARSLRLDAR